VATPISRRKFFSRSRSWVISRISGRGDLAHRRARNVLEFEGRDVDGRGKTGDRRGIGERCDRRGGRDLRRRRVGLAGEDMRAVAKARGGHRRHAPELPAAEDADRAARRQHQRESGRSATASV
jgi:hypothetical protein